MRLKSNAGEADLKAAASLEAWSIAEALVKLSPAQRSYFLKELAASATVLAGNPVAEKISMPKLATRCLKTSHHTHHGQSFENDRKHDTKGMPWPRRIKKPSAE